MLQRPIPMCLDCNYRLTGLQSNRCPECGRDFNSNNPATFNQSGRRYGRTFRSILKFPAWPFLVAAPSLFLLQLWFDRYHVTQRLYIPWICFAIAWFLAWAGIPFLAVLYNAWFDSIRPRRPAHWLIPLAFLPLVFMANWQNWAFKIAFSLSRPSMQQFAVDAFADFPHLNWPDQNFGLFHATDIHATDNLVMFEIETQWMMYAPAGIPNWAKPWAAPLGHDWYAIGSDLRERYVFMRQALLETLVSAPTLPPHTRDGLLILLDDRDSPTLTAPFAYRWSDHLYQVPAPPYRLDIQCMVRLGPPVAPLLARHLASTPVAENDLAVLGLMGPPAAPAAPAIAAKLADADPRIRETAAWALGKIGAPALPQLPALIPLLKDSDTWVVYNALLALQEIHAPATDVIPPTIEFLQNLSVRYDAPASPTAASPRYTTLDEERIHRIAQMLEFLGKDAAPAAAPLAEIIRRAQTFLDANPELPFAADPRASSAQIDRTRDAHALHQTLKFYLQPVLDGLSKP